MCGIGIVRPKKVISTPSPREVPLSISSPIISPLRKVRTNFGHSSSFADNGIPRTCSELINLIIGKPPAMPVDYQCLAFTGVYESPS